MFRKILLLLLLGHVIGDFYFQSGELAAKKEKEYRAVAAHSLLYGLAAAASLVPVWSREMMGAAMASAVFHWLIDSVKYLVCKKRRGAGGRWVGRSMFLADQLLHAASLFGVAYFACRAGAGAEVLPFFENFFALIGFSMTNTAKWILAILLVNKPANIFIQQMIGIYKPLPKPQKDAAHVISEEVLQDKNAGRFIGSLERMIMLLLLSAGQYASLGLILTAKSIARYNRIATDQYFAEYYLSGTLLSTACALICSML